MFKKKKIELLAVCDGEVCALSELADEAFASEILGVGYGLKPTSEVFRAPIAGIIENVSETRHAYSIIGESGEEVLVHIGIDTVTLGGEGFDSKVKAGDRVLAGEPIARADLSRIKEKGLETSSAVIVTNSDIIKSHSIKYGTALGGKTVAFSGKI